MDFQGQSEKGDLSMCAGASLRYKTTGYVCTREWMQRIKQGGTAGIFSCPGISGWVFLFAHPQRKENILCPKSPIKSI